VSTPSVLFAKIEDAQVAEWAERLWGCEKLPVAASDQLADRMR